MPSLILKVHAIDFTASAGKGLAPRYPFAARIAFGSGWKCPKIP